MKDNLYQKSLVMKNNASRNLEDSKTSPFLEDAYFETACFEAQQAIEFILKAVLLEYKVTFEVPTNKDCFAFVADKSDGHDLTYILQLIDKYTDFSFDKIDSLKSLAPTITMWEQKGRYQTGIRTKEETVRRILNIHKNIEEEYTILLRKKCGSNGAGDGDGNNTTNISTSNISSPNAGEKNVVSDSSATASEPSNVSSDKVDSSEEPSNLSLPKEVDELEEDFDIEM